MEKRFNIKTIFVRDSVAWLLIGNFKPDLWSHVTHVTVLPSEVVQMNVYQYIPLKKFVKM